MDGLWVVYAVIFAAVGLMTWALMPKAGEDRPVRQRIPRGLVGAAPAPLFGIRRMIDRLRGKKSEQELSPELTLLRPAMSRGALEEAGEQSLLSKIGKPLAPKGEHAGAIEGQLGFVGAKWSPREFTGLKLISATVFGIGSAFVVPHMVKEFPLLILIAASVGFVLPAFWLRAGVAKRHKAMLRLLPEVIDLLSLCMGAGLDFLGALNKVIAVKSVDKKKEPLLDELSIVIQEIKFGKRRSDALRALAKRVNLAEISSFVRTLVQADRMGTPIAEVLAVHAEDVRFQRFNRAEQEALKAPIKILAPLILCILPCVAIIVGAPILIQFSNLQLVPK